MSVEVEHLGRRPYLATLEAMRALHTEVCEGRAPGQVWLVEHDPIYTAGRATPPHDATDAVVAIERGGQITYHGPGQLTVYPIVRLPKRDVRDWLRRLEAFGVAIAREFGLDATASDDGTGVFVNGHKVASIGVAVKRWVNLHGIGINVAMDLAPWHRIRPCGRPSELMSDLSRAAGRPIDMAAAADAARRRVSVLLGSGDPL